MFYRLISSVIIWASLHHSTLTDKSAAQAAETTLHVKQVAKGPKGRGVISPRPAGPLQRPKGHSGAFAQ